VMVPFVVILSIIAALIPISGFGLGTLHTQWRSVLVYGACLVISILLLAAALATLILGATDPSEIVLPLGVPWIGMHFRIDALAAFFLFVVNLGGGAASLYAIGHGRHETAPHRVLPFYPAFLAAMNLVVLAGDAFTFLLSWELMSLTSWALVMSHHRESGNTRAGYVYLIMASFGTLALLLAFGLLAGPDGGYAFATMRASPHAPSITILVLALALLGAGSKAGLVPLHVWLPLAHPAAPSHVSALMSGVMTKVAIYGFVRIVFDLMGQPAWWAGMVVMALGGLTAWLGVLTAMMTSDLKRLLAYSTIENVGIIFIGLGLALAFRSSGMNGAAALAFTAALFHVLNHALFKSLLFFGAGAVLTSTGERDIERMGGLIHRMPLTAGAVLVGCAAISALPPLNGFASEWLTFQAILLSPALPQWGLRILIPAIGAILALAAALAAACFVRAFGTAFLGRPRSPSAAEARPTDRFSLAAMLLLASLCLLAGILPGPIIDRLAPVSQAMVGGEMPAQAGIAWLAIVPISESRSSYDGLLVFFFVGLSALLSSYAIHSLASRKLRRVPAWDCGYPEPSPLTQYSAASFSQPIRRVFGTIAFRARERVTMPAPGDNSAATFRLELHDQVWEGLYVPITRAVSFAADHLNHLQFLTIRRYLSLVFAALVILLVVLAMWL
jgi:hydrogenase-4 component B